MSDCISCRTPTLKEKLRLHADVVLPVETELILRERRIHLSVALRELHRRAGEVRRVVAEGERAGGVAGIEVVVAAALEQQRRPAWRA